MTTPPLTISPLRRSRLERGRTVVEAARELRRLSPATLPPLDSLVRSWKRWEAGQSRARPYRPLLAELWRIGEAGGDLMVLASPSPARMLLRGSHQEPHDVELLTHFRAADRMLGGAHVYGAVVRHLTVEIAPRLFGAEPAANREEMLCAAASLTDLAGWMAHDSGDNTLAQRHFEQALVLAKASCEPALPGLVYAALVIFALETRRPKEAITFARAGQDAVKDSFHPTLAARLHAMEARGLAVIGDERNTAHLLDRAHRLLVIPPDEVAPIWLSPFDEASLTTEAVLCMRALAHHDQAVTLATQGLALRAAGRARSTALASILLIDAHIRRGNLDAACHAATTLIESPQPVASMRIVANWQSSTTSSSTTAKRRPSAISWNLSAHFESSFFCSSLPLTPSLQDPSQ